MNDPKTDLIEDLANIEHQRWSDWQAWVHSKGDRHSGLSVDEPVWIEEGDMILRNSMVEHWESLMHTQYYALPDHSKQADRDQVARYWPLVVEFVADWLAQLPLDYPMALQISDRWREEMA